MARQTDTRMALRGAVVLMVTLAATGPSASAEPAGMATLPADTWHVRSSKPALSDLIQDGYARSPTFRRLVDRLNAVHVVVYVEFQITPQRQRGYLSHNIREAGEWRYLQVRLRARSRSIMISVLAHELQHALEVASDPTGIFFG